MTKEQEFPLNGAQIKWTQPVYAQGLISNHEDDPRQIRKKEIKLILKWKAERSLEPLSVYYDNVGHQMGGIAAVTINEIQPAMAKLGIPVTPDTVEEIHEASSPNSSYLGAVKRENQCALAFGDAEALKLLGPAATNIHVNATFKIVPTGFYQLLNIHAEKLGLMQ